MVPEAPLEQTDAGLVPAGNGWFVLNAREARWRYRKGRASVAFTGITEDEVEAYFPQVGVNLVVLDPGEPMARYHWEDDQEGFLVLAGKALLIVEGEERPLVQWDFVHCPPGTNHVIVGAGGGPCTVLAVGSREHLSSKVGSAWGAYTVDEAALRHGAGVEQETTDADKAYAQVPEAEPTRYRDGWLPDFG
jgi:uncharacterized cupin superfamily protein